MATSKEYRQHAAECLELANAKEFFVKSALTELAEEFNKRANQMERAERVKALRRVQDGSLYRPRRSAYRI
jgi:hypothetical protein